MPHAAAVFVSAALGGLGLSGCVERGVGDEVTTVFAASSLAPVLDEVGGDGFVASLAGSQVLRAQIEHGARPDVFVSASRAHADSVARIDGYGPGVPLFCAPLVAVVRSSDARIMSFGALRQADRFAIAARAVPAGMWAERMLALYDANSQDVALREHVLEQAVSRDLSVMQVAQRVLRGEADVAFVYEPVARSFDGRLRVIEPPAAAAVTASYWATARDDDALAGWLEMLRASALDRGRGFRACESDLSDTLVELPAGIVRAQPGVVR